MAACLKTRGRDHVDARLLQGDRFVHSGRRSNQYDSLAAELIQNLFGRNAVNKAEYGNPFVQENLCLVFETDRLVPQVAWPGSSDALNMFCQRRETAFKCLFRRGEGSFVFHGNPQIRRKWL